MTTMDVLWRSKTDEWATPQDLYDTLDGEFGFTLDAAATANNHKCLRWFGPGSDEAEDALAVDWGDAPFYSTVWLNPPYSRCKEFIGKAMRESRMGRATVVCLIPARTDTRWFHAHIYDAQWYRTRPGVELRFLKGRVKFRRPDEIGEAGERHVPQHDRHLPALEG